MKTSAAPTAWARCAHCGTRTELSEENFRELAGRLTTTVGCGSCGLEFVYDFGGRLKVEPRNRTPRTEPREPGASRSASTPRIAPAVKARLPFRPLIEPSKLSSRPELPEAEPAPFALLTTDEPQAKAVEWTAQLAYFGLPDWWKLWIVAGALMAMAILLPDEWLIHLKSPKAEAAVSKPSESNAKQNVGKPS